ncbi:MAG: MFS transporter [Verrucomicrobiota bacterium JB025]|nr:MFS transporter [Verrucomicrobiota bacterium JB025]
MSAEKTNEEAGFSVADLPKAAGLLVVGVGMAFVADYKLDLGTVASVIMALSIFGVGMFSLVKLRGAPKEMGVTFGLKLLSVTAYKILNFMLSMWLIKDLGFDESWSGGIIMTWGLFMTLATLVSGSLTDAIGLRKTLFLGVSICVITRLVMVVTSSKVVALACGLFPLAIGEALCTPVLVAAMRLYSKPSQRTVAFSLFYGLMNFGFMFGYFISDGVTGQLEEGQQVMLPVVSEPLSVYSLLIFVSMGVDLLMIPLISFLKPGVRMTETGFVALPSHDHVFPEGLGPVGRVGITIRNAASDTVETLVGLFRSNGFSKLLVFLLMIGLLKIVFNLMDYVLNPFVAREIGEAAVSKVGRLNSTNSIMILVLAPLVGIMTRKYASYTMVILGGFITASSFVFMCLPVSAFEGLASGWLGKGIGNGYLKIAGEVHPYFVMIFLWQVVFSVGEAFYSPRVYEYAASIAPPGQEASYSSLSYVPLLIGKISTGFAFSFLLDRYCPESGPRNSSMMWLIIGLMVLLAPVGLLALKRFIRVKEMDREE